MASRINLDAFQAKFIAADELNLRALTAGASQVFASDWVFVPTLPAPIEGRDALKIQFCARGQGVLAEDIPIKLDRIVDNAGHLSNDNMQGQDATRPGLLGMFDGYFENAFDKGEFVHISG
jgi:hypothetical protein